MKKRVCGAVILSILALLISFNPVRAGGLKTKALQQKIYAISSLRAKIMDKIDQAIEMRAGLECQLAVLRDEIQSEQTRSGVYSYPEVLQNLRIRYNLSLIQVLQAYVLRLNERIAYFQNGDENLKFLAQEIKDDIAIINTLKDMKIDSLTDRINRLLGEFIPEAKKPLFDVSHIRMIPVENLWSEITMYSNG
ncbi:MAG: hypothetical protein P8185_15280 [Deltaproteobacteria bacterium]|jgi:hypothetical protein